LNYAALRIEEQSNIAFYVFFLPSTVHSKWWHFLSTKGIFCADGRVASLADENVWCFKFIRYLPFSNLMKWQHNNGAADQKARKRKDVRCGWELTQDDGRIQRGPVRERVGGWRGWLLWRHIPKLHVLVTLILISL
jgi:hypothetical protein